MSVEKLVAEGWQNKYFLVPTLQNVSCIIDIPFFLHSSGSSKAQYTLPKISGAIRKSRGHKE